MARSADIRFTTHGVAHIRADSWADLGYGQGWACARDHLPTIADQIVKVRSERARFHGAGPHEANLASDLGYRSLGVMGRAPQLRDHQPDHIRDLVTGYVAGYNRAVDEAHRDSTLPDWCAGAEWIRPIDELDLYAYINDVALLGSGRNLAQLIGWARPPGPDGPHPPPPTGLGGPTPGSNGWAVGGDVTASGGGMVLANPHFPWNGEGRFWECHLTIPGELDVYGVCLLGAPGVQMGFNRHVGWAHTFSNGHRFAVYQLRVDGDGTSYHHGDDVREMTSRDETVTVRHDDGTLGDVTRSLWSTHHGPMLNLPLLGWGTEVAFSYRDANADNLGVLEQFLGMCRARSLDEFRSVFHTAKSLPWVNTLAADGHGDIWYADHSATPALSDAATERFLRRLDEDLIAALAFENRIALLDGSEPDDDWVVHDGARSPGLEPPHRLPELSARDVVANANDSHWLNHPEHTLEGYPVLCGLERTPRSLRTRQNLRLAALLAERGDVSLDDLVDVVFANASLSAELLRDAVVDRLRAVGSIVHAGATIDLVPAADVLAAWDLAAGLESVGVVLWRELLTSLPETAWKSAGPLFSVDFDPDDPLATPHTLAPAPLEGPDPIAVAAATAIVALDQAGVAIDAPLGAVQWAVRGEERVAVHGGGEAEGLLNVLAPVGALAAASLDPVPPAPPAVAGRDRTGLGHGGYQVTYGTSFLMALELTPDGPTAMGLLAYGQSGDPRSPHHRDGTVAYAEAALRPLRFTDDEIEADPALRRVALSSAKMDAE